MESEEKTVCVKFFNEIRVKKQIIKIVFNFNSKTNKKAIK